MITLEKTQVGARLVQILFSQILLVVVSDKFRSYRVLNVMNISVTDERP